MTTDLNTASPSGQVAKLFGTAAKPPAKPTTVAAKTLLALGKAIAPAMALDAAKGKPAPSPEASGVSMPDPLLLSILSTKRAHGSPGDTNFRIWLHAELKKLGCVPEIAKEGSLIVEMGKKSTTMFSCHVDTCHNVKESDGSRQKLAYDPGFGHIFLEDKATSGCLGGDDGVGIYIMLKMLAAKVPGTYVFHTGEENGGIGARAILATQAKWLENFNFCIAFDRAVRTCESPEVIATQGGKACASLAFSEQLVGMLNKFDFDDPWVVGHGGTFTDCKVYADIIPECVNLGAFYQFQHTPNEVVDTCGVEKLLAACLKLDWAALKPVRKPAPAYVAPKQSGFNGFGDFRDDYGFGESRNKPAKAPAKPVAHQTVLSAVDSLLASSKDDLQYMVDNEPEELLAAICLLISRHKGLVIENASLVDFMGG